jgi:hypothetical protein
MQEQAKLSEIAILCIVSLMALAANLPESLVGNLIDQKLLIITLTVSVVIALFRYLRLMLFITISVLAIGANIPEELAGVIDINPIVMVVTLILLVAASLLNQALKLLPTEKIEVAKLDTPESRHAILTAIMKGDLSTLHHLLAMDVEINFVHNGTAPIFLATEKGYADIVLILLSHGAKFRVKNVAGKTPMEIALMHKYTRIAEILHYAAKQHQEKQEPAQTTSLASRLFRRDSSGHWSIVIPFTKCHITNK